jgi:exodeoxyribonuclease VII large subunit
LRLRLAATRARLDAAATRLGNAAVRRVEAAGRRLAPLEGQLTQLSPLAVLERGYAIVETPDRQIVKDAAGVSEGDALRVRLNRGRLTVLVTGREEPA